MEQLVGDVPWYSSALEKRPYNVDSWYFFSNLVGDSDGHIVLALGYQDLYLRQISGTFAVLLHRGPHGILEKFKQDVIQVGGRVAK